MPSAKSPLFLWHHHLATVGPTSQSTITSFMGGNYTIPLDNAIQWDEFHAAVANDLAEKLPLFWNQRLLPSAEEPLRLRFYLDVDVKIHGLLPSEDDFLRMVRVIQKTVKQYWPHVAREKLELVVLNTQAVELNTQGAPLAVSSTMEGQSSTYKTGYHLHWHDLVVTQDQTLNMRQHCVEQLRLELPHLGIDWDVALDEGLVLQPALRMPGCHKAEKCHLCQGKGRLNVMVDGAQQPTMPCVECNGRYKVDAGRPYRPWVVLDGHGRLDAVRTDQLREVSDAMVASRLRAWKLVLAACDINPGLTPLTDGFVQPAIAPPYNTVEALKQSRGRGAKRAADRMGSNVVNDRRTLPTESVELSRDGPEAQLLSESLNQWDVYRNRIRISKLYRTVTNQDIYYYIDVSGPARSYCHNIGASHHNSGVAFMATFRGLFQRCYCNKADTKDRSLHGRQCKDYVSAAHPYASPNTPALLFAGLAKLRSIRTFDTIAHTFMASSSFRHRRWPLEYVESIARALYERLNPAVTDALAVSERNEQLMDDRMRQLGTLAVTTATDASPNVASPTSDSLPAGFRLAIDTPAAADANYAGPTPPLSPIKP